MKKIISLFIFFVFVLSGLTAFAQDDVLCSEVQELGIPQTYVKRPVKFKGPVKTPEQTLAEGWYNLSEEIFLDSFNIPVSEISYLYNAALYNNPKIYFVGDTYGVAYNQLTNTVVSVKPQYTEEDMETINQTLEAIDEATEEIMMYLDESMTDFEKIMAVHDYMVLHYDYDCTNENDNITIMTTKTGVCMSYAFAFKHLMDELGIECTYASSESMNHMWNIVKLDEEWYHIDLTWDDPGISFGQARHDFALLSDYEIQHLESPHEDYDLRGLEANSDKYDKASWHGDVGAIATIDGVYYYTDGNNLLNQDGKVIFEGLDGKDTYWNINTNQGFANSNYTGVAEYNGILYFNTDDAVYSYNPISEKTEKILDYVGICGLFVDKNTLKYCKFDADQKEFVQAGQIKLGKIRFGGTFHKDDKIIKRICKEDDAEDIYVFANCNDCVQIKKITKSDVSKISFDFKECQELYFWNKYMMPLKAKEVYNN